VLRSSGEGSDRATDALNARLESTVIKAVELFQRALEIQAAEATEQWEPEGRRNEYTAIDIALMRELRGSVWGVSALDVDENAEGPPAWVTNPWEIASWREAISLRRALLQAIREAQVADSTKNP
jgi:hypothetical protein